MDCDTREGGFRKGGGEGGGEGGGREGEAWRGKGDKG